MRRTRLTPRGELAVAWAAPVAVFFAMWGAYALGAWVLGV